MSMVCGDPAGYPSQNSERANFVDIKAKLNKCCALVALKAKNFHGPYHICLLRCVCY